MDVHRTAARRAAGWLAHAFRERVHWIKLLAVWAVAVVAPDIAIRHAEMAPRYVVALLASFAIWSVVAALLAWLWRRARPIAYAGAALFAVLVTASEVGSLGYHRYFLKDPRSLDWEFTLENPLFSWTLARTSASARDVVGIAVMLAGVTAALAWWAASPRAHVTRLRLGRLAALTGLSAVATVLVQPLTADLVGVHAAVMGTYGYLRHGGHPQTLPVPERVSVPPARAAAAPDVVLIIHESLGAAQSLREGGAAVETAAFLRKHADHAVWFPHAEAAATATCVSIPSILTGLHPEASREAFAKAPLLWHAARAVGYTSGLFSAQEYNFELFRQYFLGRDAPDAVKTASDYVPRAQRVNELGVDEAQVVDDAVRFIDGVPRDRPYFLVIQFNSTHWPCWSPSLSTIRWSSTLAYGNDPNRCAPATRYVDHQTARLLAALEARGRLEKTLVLATADHGEVFRPGRPSRRYSFYEDVLAVPFFVHLPSDLADRVGVLRDNAALRASNLDIYPTLVDVWRGAPPSAEAGLAGRSLLRPIPPDRVLVSLTDSSISHETSGFALFHRRWKWIVTPYAGVQLFDLEADPDELFDLSARAPPAERSFFRAEVARHPRMEAILDQVERKAR